MRDNQGLSVIHSQPSRKASLLQRMQKIEGINWLSACIDVLWGAEARMACTLGRGGASLRHVNTAEVCSDVGFVAVDGQFECSFADSATQKVGNIRRAR
jgi:hypothetical protein